jgi:hypothetical protein
MSVAVAAMVDEEYPAAIAQTIAAVRIANPFLDIACSLATKKEECGPLAATIEPGAVIVFAFARRRFVQGQRASPAPLERGVRSISNPRRAFSFGLEDMSRHVEVK